MLLCKPRNREDCQQATRSEERGLEHILPHSPQKEPPYPQLGLGLPASRAETVNFCCLSTPPFLGLCTLLQQSQETKTWPITPWRITLVPYVASSLASSQQNQTQICLGARHDELNPAQDHENTASNPISKDGSPQTFRSLTMVLDSPIH